MATQIIGIDCAVDDARIGLALTTVDGTSAVLEHVAVGARQQPEIETVHTWLAGAEQTLLALDAPLGWPAALAEALPQHRAGAPLRAAAHSLFRRETDRVVKQLTGKQSLDVGADRIARTAYAALAMLQALRERTGHSIPLIWSPAFGDAVGAIEVYPAATLAGYGVRAPGYKRPDQPEARRTIAAFLTSHLRLQVALDTLLASDHLIDAALCCVAGLDVLHGRAVSPTDAARAAKEGWIWFRGPGDHA